MVSDSHPQSFPEVQTETVARALQLAWDDFVSDTGNHPDCFAWRTGNLYADFNQGNFASMVAGWLNAKAAAEARLRG